MPHRDWAALGVILAYLAYLSNAVLRLLGSELSARVRTVLLAGWVVVLLFALLLVVLLAAKRGDLIFNALERFTARVQSWKGWVRGIVYAALVFLPALLVYTQVSRGLLENNHFRYAVLFALLALGVQFWPFAAPRSWASRFLITVLAGAYALLAGDYLSQVVSYPFSLSWSEGNRFYDYSLIFGKGLYLYDGDLTIPYFSPGRYALWGLWFLIPGLPIGFHRFWNALLWIAPPLLLGWLLARAASRQPGVRLGLALWLALFLSQGPIYAPILLAAALMLALDRSRLWLRGVGIAAASLYAGLSRWTWFGAAGAWGVLLELTSHESQPPRTRIKRLGAAAAVAVLGSLPGVLGNWSRFATPKQNTLSLSQPLLWYRLLPNATFEPGILLGLVQAAAPLLAILVWLWLSRRWRLDGLQLLACGGVLLITLAAGLGASVKIGGGSNLHNLDLFLITLAVLVMLFLDQQEREKASSQMQSEAEKASPGWEPARLMQDWSLWLKGLVVPAALLVAWPYYANIQLLELPPEGDVQRSMENLRAQVAKAAQEGEVLFIDQRQLLAFGYLQGVPLEPEYEKKYLMDQAMAGNAAFFQEFFRDLEAKRFTMIVTEPLFESYDDAFDPFGEENNAWVKWVSEPVLCFYAPEKTYKGVRVQLLTPRAGTKDCELPQP